MPPDHPFARLAPVLPGLPERPEPWLLGSSPQSAVWAGELGLPYSFADFINPEGAAIAALYREKFVDSERLAAPRTAVCVVDDLRGRPTSEAVELASSSRMAMSMMRQGRLIAVPPVEKALRYLESRDALVELVGPSGRARLAGHRQGRAVRGGRGVPGGGGDGGHDHLRPRAARMRSYELIAEAFGLAAATDPASAVA